MEGTHFMNSAVKMEGTHLANVQTSNSEELIFPQAFYCSYSKSGNNSHVKEPLLNFPLSFKDANLMNQPNPGHFGRTNSNALHSCSFKYFGSHHGNTGSTNARFYNKNNYTSPHHYRNTFKNNYTSSNHMIYEDHHHAYYNEREIRGTQPLRRLHKSRPIPPHNFSPFIGRNVGSVVTRHHGEGLIYPPIPFIKQGFLVNPDRFLSTPSLIHKIPNPKFLKKKLRDELSNEIWLKYLKHKQTEDQFKKKMQLWKQLYLYIKSIFPYYGLYIVGSTMSGFSLTSSDIDLCLLVRPSEMDQRIEAVSHLGQLLKFLRRLDIIEDIQLIQAKVPILKFHEVEHGFNVDINCNNSVGVRNTHLLYCYSQLDWRVKPMVILVKLWANYHQINDAKNCTISSYSLTLMVIHFLQYGAQPSVLPCLQTLYQDKFTSNSDLNLLDFFEEMPIYKSNNTQTLGELLINFLEYYSKFDYTKFAVSIRIGTIIPISDCRTVNTFKNDPHQWKLLCVEEPFDLTNAARSVYNKDIFQRIKEVFKKSHLVLQKTQMLESIFN